jgi:RNA polymerase sigma-70 factor (ECF subfamily)
MTVIGEQSLNWFAAERVEAAPDLTALVRLHSALLYRVAYSILRNSAEAEDVVQDTFLRALEDPARLAAVIEVRPWLARIAWNLALDRRHRIRPDQMDEQFAAALVSRSASAEQALDEARTLAQALTAIHKLSKAERQVLLLSAIEELSTPEIGAILGRSESSVRSLLFRARTHLRERLQRGEK